MKRKECKQGGERGKRNKKNSASFCTGSAFFSLLPPCWSMVIFLDQWFRNDAVNNERACLHTVLLPSAHPWYDIIPWLHQTSWKGDCIPFDTNFNLLLAIDNLFIAQKGGMRSFFLRLCQGGGGREQNRKNELNWSSFRILAARPSVRSVLCHLSIWTIPNSRNTESRWSTIIILSCSFFGSSLPCLEFACVSSR